jgi:hypothetical protein
MPEEKPTPILTPEGAHKLLESNPEDLSNEERALLLALISAETETGRDLSQEEQAAVNRLREQLGDDAKALIEAVKQMVTAETKEAPALDWSELKKRLHKGD